MIFPILEAISIVEFKVADRRLQPAVYEIANETTGVTAVIDAKLEHAPDFVSGASGGGDGSSIFAGSSSKVFLNMSISK